MDIEKLIPLATLTGLVGIFGYITKSLTDLNQRMKDTYEQLKNLIEREKTHEMENLKAKQQLDIKEWELKMRDKENELSDLKREYEFRKQITSEETMETVKNAKNALQQAFEQLKQQLEEKAAENENIRFELEQATKKFELQFQNGINNLEQELEEHKNRLENCKLAAKWLARSQEDFVKEASDRVLDNNHLQDVKQFVQDIKNYIDWICYSLPNGGPLPMNKLGITTVLPVSAYVDIFELIKNKSCQELNEKVAEELKLYLDHLIEELVR
jgi:DNA repair exonuclease SbcCD ATPase subunit